MRTTLKIEFNLNKIVFTEERLQNSDYFAEDDAHCIEIIRQIVKNLPLPKKTELTTRKAKPPLYDPKEIYGIVPRALSTPYDVREIIARLADGSEFLEFKALYGPTLVCGWAYIHGYPVGILGNNGILFSDSSLKATQFIQLCDKKFSRSNGEN